MKQLLAVILLVACVGCDLSVDLGGQNKAIEPVARKNYPIVDIPPGLRQQNWLGTKGEGSCVHATMISLFRHQGRPNTAAKWGKSYGNGESSEALAAKFNAEGIRYAYVTNGDVAFLEWACSTRRGCGVTVMGGRHMVALVHFDDEWAGILDPNDTSKITWVERDTFLAEWHNSYGWAVTPVYTPLPPK